MPEAQSRRVLLCPILFLCLGYLPPCGNASGPIPQSKTLPNPFSMLGLSASVRECRRPNPGGNGRASIPKGMPASPSRWLLITIKNFLYLHNNHDSIQINGSTMDKLEYISPVLDVVNIVSEAGFASSANPVDFQDGGWL